MCSLVSPILSRPQKVRTGWQGICLPRPMLFWGEKLGRRGRIDGDGRWVFEVFLGDLCGLPSVACILQDVIPDIAWRTPSASDHAAAQGFVPCSNSVARRTSLLAVAYRFRAVRKNRYLHFGAGLIVGRRVLGLSGFRVDSKPLLALGLVGSCAGAGAGGQVGLGLPSSCGLRRRYA